MNVVRVWAPMTFEHTPEKRRILESIPSHPHP